MEEEGFVLYTKDTISCVYERILGVYKVRRDTRLCVCLWARMVHMRGHVYVEDILGRVCTCERVRLCVGVVRVKRGGGEEIERDSRARERERE